MIRCFARPIREVVAMFSIVCIALTGVPVLASAQQPSERVTPDEGPTLTQMKRMVEEVERSKVFDEGRLHVVRTLLAIASTSDEHQRSALIRSLPVAISVILKADGSVVKHFFYRGEVRLTVVDVPQRERKEDEELMSGPHASESLSTGASQLCYEDKPPPCATPAQMDEAAIMAATIEGESRAMHREAKNLLQQIQYVPVEEVHSGPSDASPSDSFNCVTEGVVATGSLLASAADAVGFGKKIRAARLLGRGIASAVLSTTGAMVLGTFLVAVAATNVFVSCVGGMPAPLALQHWFEPVC